MSENRIVRASHPNAPLPSKTDWKRVRGLKARDLEEAIATDPDAAPLLNEQWFRSAKLVMPERKVPVSMRVDREVLEWFRGQGRGYLSRMHAVLRAYVSAQAAAKPKLRHTAPLKPGKRKAKPRHSGTRIRSRSRNARRHG
jgi:uncharacterized protein (DUF4415 family)